MFLESDLISYKQPLIIYYTFFRGATKCRGRISEKRPYIFSFHLGTLREKCPNVDFFLVWIQENTDQRRRRIETFFTQRQT